MRGGWLGGFGAAGGTILLLIAAAMIAQPNVRVLDGAVTGFFDSLFEEEDAQAGVEAVVDRITVESGRVRGRVHNPSSAPMSEVVVRVRLIPPGGGEGRTANATVYSLAPGAEAWFGIPLVGGPPVASAELVDVRATAGVATGATGPTRSHLPSPSRRSGVGGMQDVQQQEQDMKKMQDAVRDATGGH